MLLGFRNFPVTEESKMEDWESKATASQEEEILQELCILNSVKHLHLLYKK